MFGACESSTYHHVRGQVVPSVYHWHDTEGSTWNDVRLGPTNDISKSAKLAERYNVLHADNEHKSRSRVARICLRSEVRCRDEADNETELLQRPAFPDYQQDSDSCQCSIRLTHDNPPRAVRLRVVRSKSINDNTNHAHDSRQDQRDERVLRKVGAAAAFGEPKVGLVAQPSSPEHRN